MNLVFFLVLVFARHSGSKLDYKRLRGLDLEDIE